MKPLKFVGVIDIPLIVQYTSICIIIRKMWYLYVYGLVSLSNMKNY